MLGLFAGGLGGSQAELGWRFGRAAARQALFLALDHGQGAADLLLGGSGGRVDGEGLVVLGQSCVEFAGGAQLLAVEHVRLSGLEADTAGEQLVVEVGGIASQGLLILLQRLVEFPLLFELFSFGSQPITLFGFGGGRQGQGREDRQDQRRGCEDRY